MPYFTVSTSLNLSSSQKQEIVSFITEKTNELLGIFLDKIQVTIHLKASDCMGRAGVSLSSSDFSSKSRIMETEALKSYYSGKVVNEELVVIELDIWENNNEEGKNTLFKEITDFFKQKYMIPGDDVLILIREMKPKSWIQNGVPGDDSLFLEKSRKYVYLE